MISEAARAGVTQLTVGTIARMACQGPPALTSVKVIALRGGTRSSGLFYPRVWSCACETSCLSFYSSAQFARMSS